MKPILFALVSLTLGVALGWVITRSEFARDTIPVQTTPAGSNSAAEKSGPIASVLNGERFEFGSMDRYGTLSHEFEITNTGDAPLEMSLGKTTCKCTIGKLTDNVLEPGEKTSIRLEWTAKTGEPEFEQSASIITNDPKRNPLNLTVHGKVRDLLHLEQMDFALGDIATSETVSRQLRIFASKEQDLQIVKHEWLAPSGADHLRASFEPVPKAELGNQRATSGVAVVLHVDPGLPLGALNQTLRVTTNIAEHGPLDIPVSGTIVSDISLMGAGVTPHRLHVNLGTLDTGKGTERTLYLMVKGPLRDETKLNVVDIQPAGDLQATLGEPLRDNPKVVRYPLTIRVSPQTLPVARVAEESYGKIKIAVADSQVKELTVRVRFVVNN